MEKFESDLLREAEGLKYLLELFQGFDSLLAKFNEEYGEYIDTTLLMAVECLQYDVAVIAEGNIVLDETTVPGIIKQLDDVMDEVQVFQAGKATKGDKHEGGQEEGKEGGDRTT